MKSKSSDEQDVHEATAALKGLLGLGGGGGNGGGNHGLQISPTAPTPSSGVTSATNTNTQTTNEESVTNIKIEESDSGHNNSIKSKKKKSNKKKKSPTTTTDASICNTKNSNGRNTTTATTTNTTTTPPSSNTKSQPKNANKITPKSTSKKQNNNNKKESENYAWSAFQSSPDPNDLPIPSFLSPTTSAAAAVVGGGATPSSSHVNNSSNNMTFSPDTVNTNATAMTTTAAATSDTITTTTTTNHLTISEIDSDHLPMTTGVQAESSPLLLTVVRHNIPVPQPPSDTGIATKQDDERHVVPKDTKREQQQQDHDMANTMSPSLLTVRTPEETIVHRTTGINLAAALAASRPTDTGANARPLAAVATTTSSPSLSTSPFISPPLTNHNNMSHYPMAPSMLYPNNNFGPPQHGSPYHRYPMPQQQQQQHPMYRNVTPPQPSHMNNSPYPLPQHGPPLPVPNPHLPHTNNNTINNNPYASPPGYMTIQVQVPPNLIMPGRTMIVPSPAGYPVQIAIPDGVLPGMIIPVHVPMGPPLHMMPPPQPPPMLHQLPPQMTQVQPHGPYLHQP